MFGKLNVRTREMGTDGEWTDARISWQLETFSAELLLEN
jgi:hypothetical protein